MKIVVEIEIAPERLADELRHIAEAIDGGYNNGFYPKFRVMDAETRESIPFHANFKNLERIRVMRNALHANGMMG